MHSQNKPTFVCFLIYIYLFVADGRVLQYGQMSMSSEAEGDPLVTKAYKEARGDQGLLNLLTDNTVFYVGGYPKSFKVRSLLLHCIIVEAYESVNTNIVLLGSCLHWKMWMFFYLVTKKGHIKF